MTPEKPVPGRLHPTVISTGWVSFFTDFSSEIIYPLLPLFLTSVLGAGAFFVGWVEGLAEATASLVKLVSGRLADRMGRCKPLILLGYGLSSLARPAVALAGAPWHVLALRFVDRVGKGIRGAPRDALICSVTPPEERGRAFGFQRAMDHLGAVAGPLAATALLGWAGWSLREVFAAAALPAAAAMIVAAVGIRETASQPVEAPPAPAPDSPALPAPFAWLLASVVLFALANSSDAFLLLRARELGVAEAWLPALWAALHVVKSALSTAGGGLSDRLGRRRTIAAGWVLYAGVYCGLAMAESAWQVWALFAVYGMYFALTEGAERALVAELAPGGKAGGAFGLYHLAVGLAALPASVLAGLLWQRFGAPVALLTGAGLALVALVPLSFSAASRAHKTA